MPGESWVPQGHGPSLWAAYTASACTLLPHCCLASSAHTLHSMGNKGQTKGNHALLGSFQEFDSLFISALLHKQQGQLQQGIWDQVVVIFNPLFTAGQRKTWLTGSALETSFRHVLQTPPEPLPNGRIQLMVLWGFLI